MSKLIEVTLPDGSIDRYKSSLLRGYHLKEAKDGVCVTMKTLFEKEATIKCYPKQLIQGFTNDRCTICEAVNPTQKQSS